MSGKNVASALDVDCLRLRYCMVLVGQGKFPCIGPVADEAGQKAWIVSGSVEKPLPCRFIADQQFRHMTVAVIRIRLLIKAYFFAEQVDICLLAGKKSPARTSVVLVSIVFEHGGCIALGIN